MKRKSNSDGPRFVEPTKKGRYVFVILVLVAACSVLGYLYSQVNSENADLKSQLSQVKTTTTTTKPSPSVTSTTTPESQIAKVDVIANNNDSNRTTTRIRTDFEGQVIVTQVPSSTPIEATVLVVNNPAFESLAQELVAALGGTISLVPEGQQASVADIVIYVKS